LAREFVFVDFTVTFSDTITVHVRLAAGFFAQPALTESWQPENISIGCAFVESTRKDLIDGRTFDGIFNSEAPLWRASWKFHSRAAAAGILLTKLSGGAQQPMQTNRDG
jgi:hypothetical protein